MSLQAFGFRVPWSRVQAGFRHCINFFVHFIDCGSCVPETKTQFETNSTNNKQVHQRVVGLRGGLDFYINMFDGERLASSSVRAASAM